MPVGVTFGSAAYESTRRCRRLQIVPGRAQDRGGVPATAARRLIINRYVGGGSRLVIILVFRRRRCTCALILARALARPSEVLSQRPSPGPGTTMGCLVNCRARGIIGSMHDYLTGPFCVRGPSNGLRGRTRSSRSKSSSSPLHETRWARPAGASAADSHRGLHPRLHPVVSTGFFTCFGRFSVHAQRTYLYLSITVRIPSAECHLRTLSPPGRRKAGGRWLGRTSPRSM